MLRTGPTGIRALKEPSPEVHAEEPASALMMDDGPVDLSDLRWSDGLVFVIFWLLAFIVFLQFFTRYVLNDSLGWTEEVARFMLIAVTFVGSVMAARKESHIAVELLFRYLPRRGRLMVQLSVDAFSIVFYGGLAFLCTRLAGFTHQKMVSINLPKSAIYWGVSVCLAIMALYATAAFVRHLRTKTSRLVDPERFAQTNLGL